MPTGYKRRMTGDEIEQRREASRKHGVYAFRDNGEEALSPPQRSRFSELSEQLETRSGVVEALKGAALQTLMMAEIAQAFCVSEYHDGKRLDSIKLLKSLPAFWNSAGRALKSYLDALPEDADVLDLADAVIKGMGNGNSDSA